MATFSTKRNQKLIYKEQELYLACDYLKTLNLLKKDKFGLDIHPCAILFSKTAHHSQLEALALFEMGLHYSTKDFHLKNFPAFYQELVLDSTLLIGNTINKEYISYTKSITQEFSSSILSETLSVLYTDYIIDRTGPIEYKNKEEKMVDFKHKDWILKVMPQKGIPTNRDISKNLQIFYKDTLMHEFSKCCPICGCALPKMLIGSHIKPFRDCAHLYEAACHDNGLLLCRNHDFLFDQGYLSFDNQGHAIIHSSIKEEKELYQIHDLDTKYLSSQRKLFLAYHREHILKK